MEAKTKYNVGDKIYVGYVPPNYRYGRFYGPLIITEVVLSVRHVKDKKEQKYVAYIVNEFTEEFIEDHIHESLISAASFCENKLNVLRV